MKPIHSIITTTLSEIKWSLEISDLLLQKQLALKSILENHFQKNILEIGVGFKTLGISWKSKFPFKEVQALIDQFEEMEEYAPLSNKVWQIPACYDLELGRDLENLASAKGLEVKALIDLHSKNNYRLHFYGFLPGFMYLQGLPEVLFTPRKSLPDASVPAGSIAIGGNQTGIYPSVSPGGWHLIGQTPIILFDPSNTPPVWASPGDLIKFNPISIEEFKSIQQNPQQPVWEK
ncbi:5-oxoprolinase subunit PxpB [Algoriphagus lutimaris]|uniref:5-oxoprolinase subunit PxpB n=1 Tax=Algoriphagus lutimaris TaxID=613197 RepID=UPI00196A31CB|nr:5-oxoprolinase subunit PxpB [Algoriphagus lutimaris]MBN3518924.1 5-oxoprolinase subunit PxpB [Algoriphagus lutimaris]